MAVVEITIIPIGTEGPSLSDHVAKALEVLEKKKLKYELTSTGTIVEGDLEEVLEVAKEMHESVFDESISRVVTKIEIDERKDKNLQIEGKKKSVKDKLKKSTNKS